MSQLLRALTVVGSLGLALAFSGCPKPADQDVHFIPDGGLYPNNPGPASCDWTQWGKDSTHTSYVCNNVQTPNKVLGHVVYDPFVEQELAEAEGPLTAHYPSPLLVGDDVYMMQKTGTYISCEPAGSGQLADGGACGSSAWNSQNWNYKRFHWENGQLVEKWSYWTDWTPVPVELAGWEPSYQGAIAGDFLYLPGAGGSVHKVDRITGLEASHIQPFGATDDPSIFVAGGLTTDANGNVFYNAIQIDPSNPYGSDANGWLVKVKPDDSFSTATFTDITTGAPAATDACTWVFRQPNYLPPYPPAPVNGAQVFPPEYLCGTQRPGINVIPAVGSDGTVYTAGRAHYNARYSYLIAVNNDLTPKWTASLRDRIDDGCGVLIPADATDTNSVSRSHCREGSQVGVEPATNLPPAPWVDDSSSSSPVVLPDNSVLYGALTIYNTSRGHLMKFSSTGEYLGSYDFGWDVTPAVFPHDGTYDVIVKDNHYFYWDNRNPDYEISALHADLTKKWSYQNAETNSCVRAEDGTVTCTSDHPSGFEWCINAPSVDPQGNVYVNSEDGNLYVLDPTGAVKSKYFLRVSLEAAYTPLSIDSSGRIYTLNHGEMFVLGQ